VGVKGFRLVIEVARTLPEVRFVIAGDGPDQGVLARQAEGLGNVEFTGFVDEQRVRALLRGSLAVVVPSEWPEPFGMVVLEAWREGRAVIVTNRGALPEIVDHGRTGITIEAGDVAAAASAISELKADPAKAARLGAAGRREVETTYSLSRHLDRLEATYAELVG
jgi:glycosyltransferase involved in cell wall biosynthesis